jgi:hypothetical protein
MTGGAWERERLLRRAALKLKGLCITARRNGSTTDGSLSQKAGAELNGFGVETQLFREHDSARRLGGLTDVLWVVKDHEAGRRRQKLAERRHALRHELGGDTSHAREIAAWTSEALDEAGGDRFEPSRLLGG